MPNYNHSSNSDVFVYGGIVTRVTGKTATGLSSEKAFSVMFIFIALNSLSNISVIATTDTPLSWYVNVIFPHFLPQRVAGRYEEWTDNVPGVGGVITSSIALLSGKAP